VERLDLATVIKVSQAVSSEILLDKLLDTLMRAALEHAGAGRGLMILLRGEERRIAAEAITSGDAVTVQLRDETATAAGLPESVLHYVLYQRPRFLTHGGFLRRSFADSLGGVEDSRHAGSREITRRLFGHGASRSGQALEGR
jgi:hypothetical protein